MVEALIPSDSIVTSYSFPLPVNARTPGRLSTLRSGRMIYEFIEMTDDDLATVAYKYSFILKTDIKNFYPSIYTHSLAWALHGKAFIRTGSNRSDYTLLGNRLDKLFQCANDGRTNGIPIGPVVSDIAAELVASAVDRRFSDLLGDARKRITAVRFKDDYRVLVSTRDDARLVIACLQRALSDFNLELNDQKTRIETLPEGLFRPWVSRYHAVHPRKRKRYPWKQFRELYLSVVAIDRDLPGTGVIDRFLADIIDRKGRIRVELKARNLQKVLSMLLMLGGLRSKAFPKVVAIIESILNSPLGAKHKPSLVTYLGGYLEQLSEDEHRNRYLITWILYFLASNQLLSMLGFTPAYATEFVKSVYGNRSEFFTDRRGFTLFESCRKSAKRLSMLEHLDVFNPPKGR